MNTKSDTSDNKTERISVRISAEMKQWFDDAFAANGITPSEKARRILQAAMDRERPSEETKP